MQHKGRIYHYMQKFRFFAAIAAVTVLLSGATFPARAATARIDGVPFPSESSLPVTEQKISPVTEVIPGGDAVAVRLTAAGVVVVGFTDDDRDNPARTAGLKKGDLITKVGDRELDGNQSLADGLKETGGRSVTLQYTRNGKNYETTLCPRPADGGWQIGVLVKDSTAGIGTLTYILPDGGNYGCLGHGITDPDTETLFCVGRGDLYPAKITGLRKGQCGTPGELQGAFGSPALGTCVKNCETGLFGRLDRTLFQDRQAVPVASKNEIKEGDATIRCTVDDSGVQEYSVKIVRIYRTFGSVTKNMLVRVTDERLLEKTGGIVQGMSGSPIFQNGKLVGAVTHVLINDPTSGYGIFIENMLTGANQ